MTYTRYPAIIYKDEEGIYQVSFPDFPGCFTYGRTYDEAVVSAEEILSLWIEQLKENNIPLPNKNTETILSNISIQQFV